jgi:hypothetical protein
VTGSIRYSTVCVVLLTTLGCAITRPATPPMIRLSLEDGARWIDPDDTGRYVCDQSVLFCRTEIGRLTSRLCRCESGVFTEMAPVSSAPE